MKTMGFDKPLYSLPFNHRGSFQTKMFGWTGTLSPDQTAQIAATKQVIYDAFKTALESGVPAERAGILVDEQFGAAILRNAGKHGYMTTWVLRTRRHWLLKRPETFRLIVTAVETFISAFGSMQWQPS